jgi:hypothetical protein
MLKQLFIGDIFSFVWSHSNKTTLNCNMVKKGCNLPAVMYIGWLHTPTSILFFRIKQVDDELGFNSCPSPFSLPQLLCLIGTATPNYHHQTKIKTISKK